MLLSRSVSHDQGVGGEVQSGRLQRADLHQGKCSSSVSCATLFLKGVSSRKNVFSVSITQDFGVRWHQHKTEEEFGRQCHKNIAYIFRLAVYKITWPKAQKAVMVKLAWSRAGLGSGFTCHSRRLGNSKAPEKLHSLLISPSDLSVYKWHPSRSGLRLYFYPSERQLEL